MLTSKIGLWGPEIIGEGCYKLWLFREASLSPM